MTPETRELLIYLVVALCGVLGFWIVWSLMDRFTAGRAQPEGERAWYDILGVASDADEDEIRGAHQREVEKGSSVSTWSMDAKSRALASARSRELERALREGLAAMAARRGG